jgi:hypothetical protein
MNWLRSALSWLSKPNHQKTLAFIGGGLAIAIGGAWQAYLHFSEKPKETPTSTISASNGSIAAGGNVSSTASTGGISVVATGNVTIGITLEQYEAGLKRKEQETRTELAQASITDKNKIALLEKEQSEVQAKLKNPEAALEEYKNKLVQAYRALDDLKQEIPLNQLEQAQQALTKGQSSDAEVLFQKVRSQGKEKAAEADYQLKQLADDRKDDAQNVVGPQTNQKDLYQTQGADDNSLKVVIIRHGEKPETGDNLSCQGENRALQLPAVLYKKYNIGLFCIKVRNAP